MSRYLHFSLGPVQGFVAQARRTRDFWAGSFILSYLSGVAMKSILAEGGEVLFPEPDPEFLSWLGNPNPERGRRGPTQGSVPNRFKAKVDDGFEPTTIEKSVRDAWREIADLVWREDIADLGEDCRDESERIALDPSKEIWRRQVEGFWEIAWIVTDEAGANDLLDRRKLWRDHQGPDEPGIKCSLMEGWQELSGATQPGDPRLEAFWRVVQTRIKGNDLREGEHLCALALIKRRFARHLKSLRVPLNGWVLHGWDLPTAVPSVTYLAAAPWLARVIPRVAASSMDRFQKAASKLSQGYGEWHSDLRCLVEAEGDRGKSAQRFRALDGGLFFESNLENAKVYPDRGLASKVQQALANLQKEAGVGAPAPFYAALMMDGDSLGLHLRVQKNQPLISQALADFTRDVPAIVSDHSGFLVYAGGDDVLALLPLDWALECTVALREAYLRCFTDRLDSTLSGALVIAHHRVPLHRVLRDVHRLLDDVAKEERGRDALAINVQTLGASFLEWSMPWDSALEQRTDSDGSSNELRIDALAREFAVADHELSDTNNDEQNERFSSGFFFRIGKLFALINPRKGREDDPSLSETQAVDLMTSEYLASGLRRGGGLGDRGPAKPSVTLQRARQIVGRLLTQCRPVTRGPKGKQHVSPRLEPDGSLLVRFLAFKRRGS